MTTSTQLPNGSHELPETMQIAQLLAELMPITDDSALFAPPAVDAPKVEMPSPPESPDLPAEVVPQTGPAVIALVESQPPPMPEKEVKLPELPKILTPVETPAEVRMPEPQHVEAPRDSTIIMPPPLPKPLPVPPPLPVAATPEVTALTPAISAAQRIPLGDLTVAGYFSLVNWTNDPLKVRHPPYEPRYDARTIAELGKIPYVSLDAPAQDDEWSVTAVLKSFAW
jgi:hypothetical protein